MTLFFFFDDGSCTQDENTDKCANDQQVEHASWYFLDNDTKLAIIDDNPDTMSVVSLTTNELKLQSVGQNALGIPITWTMTWKNIK